MTKRILPCFLLVLAGIFLLILEHYAFKKDLLTVFVLSFYVAMCLGVANIADKDARKSS